MKKPKICKCGHDKQDHYKEPRGKLSFPNECNRCKCSDYMKRSLPDFMSKFMLYYGVGVIVLMVIAIPLLYFSPEVYNHWNDKVISVSTIMITLFALFGVASLTIFTSFITQYFSEKHRKTYEIEP